MQHPDGRDSERISPGLIVAKIAVGLAPLEPRLGGPGDAATEENPPGISTRLQERNFPIERNIDSHSAALHRRSRPPGNRGK
jgi:hypothetical protein